MAKRKESLSKAQVKIRILAYLYNKGSQGANSYTIQQKANIPSSQESNRFKGFLEELCALSRLEKYEVETGSKSVSGLSQSGSINVIYGSSNGLKSLDNQIWYQWLFFLV